MNKDKCRCECKKKKKKKLKQRIYKGSCIWSLSISACECDNYLTNYTKKKNVVDSLIFTCEDERLKLYNNN